MNTPQERREAAKAIARMRPEPTRKRLTRNSRALEIDHYRDAQELSTLKMVKNLKCQAISCQKRTKSIIASNLFTAHVLANKIHLGSKAAI